jgi:hypothetical protein
MRKADCDPIASVEIEKVAMTSHADLARRADDRKNLRRCDRAFVLQN